MSYLEFYTDDISPGRFSLGSCLLPAQTFIFLICAGNSTGALLPTHYAKACKHKKNKRSIPAHMSYANKHFCSMVFLKYLHHLSSLFSPSKWDNSTYGDQYLINLGTSDAVHKSS